MPKKGEDGFDKLYKVRPFLDCSSKTFKDNYNPTQNQSIDESMIRFKGRHSLKQYMPNKPIKRGYKIWVRADEKGFICQFHIYTGKLNETAETELGLRVVTDLTRDLVRKDYSIYCDNFFSSVTLMHKMMADRIKCCATTRSNRRQFPKRLQPKKKD